jgi:hypothetical protein
MRALVRMLSIIAVALATLGLTTGPALAANAHVVKGPSVSVSGDTLKITASIAGLGDVGTATFDLSGNIVVSSRCYNHGGNKPQADNKQETVPVDASGTFDVRNGRTNVSFAVTAASTLTCPGNQVVVIESFAWTWSSPARG